MLSAGKGGGGGARGERSSHRRGRQRRSHAWRRYLHRFAHSPTTKFLTGAFLLLTAIAELVEGIFLDLAENLEPSHALFVLGFIIIIQSLAEILEAAEFIDEAGGEP